MFKLNHIGMVQLKNMYPSILLVIVRSRYTVNNLKIRDFTKTNSGKVRRKFS